MWGATKVITDRNKKTLYFSQGRPPPNVVAHGSGWVSCFHVSCPHCTCPHVLAPFICSQWWWCPLLPVVCPGSFPPTTHGLSLSFVVVIVIVPAVPILVLPILVWSWMSWLSLSSQFSSPHNPCHPCHSSGPHHPCGPCHSSPQAMEAGAGSGSTGAGS